jgi:hypothetical protein
VPRRDRRHRMEQRSGVRASAWTTEELAHLVRESTCDREAHKTVIPIDDIRARFVGMRTAPLISNGPKATNRTSATIARPATVRNRMRGAPGRGFARPRHARTQLATGQDAERELTEGDQTHGRPPYPPLRR